MHRKDLEQTIEFWDKWLNKDKSANIAEFMMYGGRSLDACIELKENNNGWIPVSERLPNKSEHYITTYREWTDGNFLPKYDPTEVKILKYHDAVFILPKCLDDKAEQDIHREVIAWQPLPEPYEKKEGAE